LLHVEAKKRLKMESVEFEEALKECHDSENIKEE